MSRSTPQDLTVAEPDEQAEAPPLEFAGRRIGPHLPHATGLLKAAERAGAIGATAIQIFSDNPTAWRRRREPPPDLDAFRTRLAELGIGPLAIHAPYLINLAGADPTVWEQSIATLASELRVGAAYGARFVNVHAGSHRGQDRKAGLERLADGLRRVLELVPGEPGGPLLVLENSSGAGDGVGSTLEDLSAIQEAAGRGDVQLERIGFCIDTAHLWGAGLPIDDPDAIDRLLDRLDAELGPGRLAMLHLNDSRAAFGSRLDRHEHIGAGLIGIRGLRHLLTTPRLAGLPTYLETPGMDVGYDATNLERVRHVIEGEQLPELPPEAFTLRGGRTSKAHPPDPATAAR